MKELEIEFKNLLTKDEYNRIITHFNLSSPFTQTNYYFDTINKDVKNKVGALRVREKDNKFTLTLKCPAEVGLYEINQKITKEQFQSFLNNHKLPNGEVLLELSKYSLNEYEYYNEVSLTTNRIETTYKNGLLVLDESLYNGIIDYELEYEVTDYDEGLKDFQELLIVLNITQKETLSKIKRAYNSMNKVV